MWVFDPQTQRVMELNEAAARKYGYTREEFLSLTVDAISPLAAAGSAGATNFAGVWPHRTKSGKTFAASVTQTNLCFEGRNAILVISSDMTAHRGAETERELRGAIGGSSRKALGM